MQPVAVSAGASQVHRLEFPFGHVSAMRFPPGLALPGHHHPQATVAVVVSGGFTGLYHGGERDCEPQSVIVEPAGEQHANHFGRDETAVVAVSLQPGRLGEAVEAAARRFRSERDPFAEFIAQRVAHELDHPDDVTPLAVEAAALEIVTRIARTARLERKPAWLRDVRDLLHDRYAESLTLVDVASAVGIRPERIARAFRREYGEPLAAYLRRIRVDAAAHLLRATELPISQVAVDVGFADQAHLTRCFGRYLGTTPARYRADVSPPGRARPRYS